MPRPLLPATIGGLHIHRGHGGASLRFTDDYCTCDTSPPELSLSELKELRDLIADHLADHAAA